MNSAYPLVLATTILGLNGLWVSPLSLTNAAIAQQAPSPSPSPTQTATPKPLPRYPESLRNNYLNSCIQNSLNRRSLCECTLRKMEARYSVQQFRQIDEDIRERRPIPREILQIIDDCRPRQRTR